MSVESVGGLAASTVVSPAAATTPTPPPPASQTEETSEPVGGVDETDRGVGVNVSSSS